MPHSAAQLDRWPPLARSLTAVFLHSTKEEDISSPLESNDGARGNEAMEAGRRTCANERRDFAQKSPCNASAPRRSVAAVRAKRSGSVEARQFAAMSMVAAALALLIADAVERVDQCAL